MKSDGEYYVINDIKSRKNRR